MQKSETLPPTMRARLQSQREGAVPPQSKEPSENTSADENAPKPTRTLKEIFSEEASSRGESVESNTSGSQSKGQSESSQKAPKLTDLNSLAETLKIKPEDLYKVKIPLGGEKSLTLGEIKDLASKDHDFDAREFDFEERRSKQEGDLLRAKNEVTELLSMIPQKLLNKELLDKARVKYDAFVQTQRRETLDLIPEWKDEKKREEETAEIVDHLSEYGISKAEFLNIVDAKAIRYIRVNWLRQKRVDRMMEEIRKQDPKTGAPSKSSNGKAPKRPLAREPKAKDGPRARMMSVLDR